MSPALQAALARVVPSYMQAVNGEQERQVVMAVLEALTAVLRGCGNLALQPPGRLAELCHMLKAVLQRKVSRAAGCRVRRWPGPRRGWPDAGSPDPASIHPEERRGRGAHTELSSSLPQTACQDADEEEEEDQVRAMGTRPSPQGRVDSALGLGLGPPGWLKDWQWLRVTNPAPTRQWGFKEGFLGLQRSRVGRCRPAEVTLVLPPAG